MYELTIQELHDKLMDETAKTKKLMSRAATETLQNDSRSSCAICMDEMKGRVSLVCGHEMCPECFAQHAVYTIPVPFVVTSLHPNLKYPIRCPFTISVSWRTNGRLDILNLLIIYPVTTMRMT